MTDNKNPKTLIVYYSHSGNTRFIAEAMAGAAGVDLAELLPKKEINLSGAAYVGWGARQLLRKDEREVEPIPYDIAVHSSAAHRWSIPGTMMPCGFLRKAV